MQLHRLLLPVFIAALLLRPNLISAQCAFGGTWLNYNITPTQVGETVDVNGLVPAGRQLTLYANQGCTYVITTCGSSWNTRLTLFDPNDAYVAQNDNYCGQQSQITFTAATSGP